MERNTKNVKNNEGTVVFEKIDDHTGQAITQRNGQTFTIKLFTLTKENIEEINKIKEEMYMVPTMN